MRGRIMKRSVEAMRSVEGKDVLLFDTEIAGFGCKLTPTRKDGHGVEPFRARTRCRQAASAI